MQGPSEYMFNLTRGKQSDAQVQKRNEIAEQHGCAYNYINDPGQGWIGWYAGPNRGFPFDRDLERAVAADENAAGLD